MYQESRDVEGLIAIQLHKGNPHRVEIKDLQLKVLEDAELIPFDRAALEADGKRIDRPRTTRPKGLGPVIRSSRG